MSLLVVGMFLFNTTVHGMDLPKKTCLRVPLLTDGKKRPKEVLDKITRRDFIKKIVSGAVATGIAGSFSISFEGDAPSISIVSLLKNTGGAPKKPYLGKDYFVFGSDVFLPNGKWLGYIEDIFPQKIIDMETREVIGLFNWYMCPLEARDIYDSTGKVIKAIVKEKVIAKIDGIEKRIYTIFMKAPNERLIKAGYLSDLNEGYLYDNHGKEIALVENTRLSYIISSKDKPIITGILDESSLSHYFFNQPTSIKLYQELQKTINEFNPTEINGKILKIELVRRAIEMELELGLIPDIVMEHRNALHAYNELKGKSIEKLSDFTDLSAQRIIWNAVANSHPKFKLYYEAVKRLNFEKDSEILKKSIGFLKKGFRSISGRFLNESKIVTDAPMFNKITKDILEGLLLYNSSSTVSEILFSMRALFNKENIFITQMPECLTIVSPVSMLVGRGISTADGKDVSSFLLANAEAIALKREGYDATLIIANNIVEIKGDDIGGSDISKVPRLDCFILVKDEVTGDSYPLDPEFMYKKALKVNSDFSYIEDEFDFKDVYKINAEKLSLLPRSMKKYLKVKDPDMPIDQDFTDFPSNTDYSPSFFSSFNLEPAYGCYKSQSILDETIVGQNNSLFNSVVKKYGIKIESEIEDKEALRERKSNFITVCQILPEKFISKLKAFRFREKIPTDNTIVTGVDSKGDLIYEKIEEANGLHKKGNIIEQADRSLGTTVHEFAHDWEDVTPENVKEIFYNITWMKSKSISWEEAYQTNRAVLKTKKEYMFARPYGMTDFREDFATILEDYVIGGPLFRTRVKALMEKGRFELAAKYLFAKYVVLKDFDGKFFEYDVDVDSLPITLDEVNKLTKAKFTPSYIQETIKKIKEIADDGDIYDRLSKNVRTKLGSLGLSKSAIEHVFSRGVLRYEKGQIKGNILMLKLFAKLEGTSVANVLRRSMYHERIHDLLHLYNVDMKSLTLRLKEQLGDIYRKMNEEFVEEFGEFNSMEEFTEELIVKYYAYRFSGQDKELFESDLFGALGETMQSVIPESLHKLFIIEGDLTKENQIIKLKELTKESKKMGGRLNIQFDEEGEADMLINEIKVLLEAAIFTPRQKAPSVKAGMNGAGSGFAQANPAIKDATAVKPWSFTAGEQIQGNSEEFTERYIDTRTAL